MRMPCSGLPSYLENIKYVSWLHIFRITLKMRGTLLARPSGWSRTRARNQPTFNSPVRRKSAVMFGAGGGQCQDQKRVINTVPAMFIVKAQRLSPRSESGLQRMSRHTSKGKYDNFKDINHLETLLSFQAECFVCLTRTDCKIGFPTTLKSVQQVII